MDKYKGINKVEFSKLSREQQLAMMALVRPGADTDDPAVQDQELYDYCWFFFGIKFPRECSARCKGRCTPPFKVLADVFYARYPLIILKASRGCGKAQPLSQPVLTPEGWKTMGDIRVGDFVIGETGKPVEVIAIHPQGKKPIYEVCFNDKTSTLCCGDHLWKVRCGKAKWSKKSKTYVENHWRVKSTEDLKGNLSFPRGDTIWRIPTVKPVEFSEKKLSVDPYLLGCLLGDGGLRSGVKFTCADKEMVERLEGLCPPGVTLKQDTCPSNKKGYAYTFSSPRGQPNLLLDQLRELGVMGHLSVDKFVPEEYLWGSVEQRLALLQGLMDTDGHACAISGADITLGSQRLRDDIAFLVQSLGGLCTKSDKRVKGYDRVYSRLRIKFGDPNMCPFRLSRKVAAWKYNKYYGHARLIKDIKEAGEAECVCITVDSSEHTYLTNDCIVTHNSALATTLALLAAVSKSTLVDILGASLTQSEIVMENLANENPKTRGCWWDAPNAPVALQDPKKSLKAEQVLVNGGRINCLTASPKTVRGRRPTLLICDEIDEAELPLIKSAQGCPASDMARNIRKCTLMCSTHQHVDGTMSFYLKMARDRNAAATKKAGKPTTVIPIYQYCYRDVLTTNGGFLDPQDIEDSRISIPEDVWEAEYENAEPSPTGRIFKKHQLEYLFDRQLYGEGPENTTEFLGDADDPPVRLDLKRLFPSKTVEEHGHIRRFRFAKDTLQNLDFHYGADFANDVDWSIYTGLATNTLKSEDHAFLFAWQRTGRKDTWKEIVEAYNDFANEEPGMGAHDETGNKAVNDYIQCDSEGFIFTRKSKKEILDALVVAIQNRRIKGPFIQWAYDEFKFLTREHLNGKLHLPDSVASLALAWYARGENLDFIPAGVAS